MLFRARYPVNLGGGRVVPPGEIVEEATRWPRLLQEQEVNAGHMEPVVPDGQGGWRLGPMRTRTQIDGYAHGDVISEPERLPDFERWRGMRALTFVLDEPEQAAPPPAPRGRKKRR